MKKFLMFLAAGFLALSAGAAVANYYNVVTIHLKDNTKMDLVISKEVKMNFTETHLIVEGTGSQVEIERTNLAKFVHTYDADAAIDDVKATGSATFRGDKVLFYGLPANTKVSVYNLSGREMISTTASGDYELDLSGLSKGVYIVNANGNSLKVTVK